MYIRSFCTDINYPLIFFFFFFNDTATTEIYTLSLHDALPIFSLRQNAAKRKHGNISKTTSFMRTPFLCAADIDRKSTRLNSSHITISYAVFCLKKKNK